MCIFFCIFAINALAAPAPNGPGNALNFDGVDDYLEAGQPTLPTGNSPYTIEAWIKTSAMNSGTIAGWGNYGLVNRVNAFRLTPTGLVNYWWGNDLAVSTPNLAGAWHHVAATFDGMTRRIFLDGTFVGGDNPVGHNAGAGNFTIGSGNGTEFFSGQMDELRIWNIGRSAVQIQSDMRRQLFGNESGLVAYYRMDEGGGLSAVDSTGDANNTATLVNGPSWVASTVAPFAPPILTLAASDLTGSTATLNGNVDGRTSDRTFEAWFEWGDSPALGNELRAGVTVPTGAVLQNFALTLTGLVPGTTYYFRAVANNGYGPSYGATLTTSVSSHYTLVGSIIAGGGGETSGGGYNLIGTIGQWDADPTALGTGGFVGGFWSSITSAGSVSFSAGFNNGLLPQGTIIFGSSVVEGDGGVGDSGSLKLTKALADQQGSWIIPDFSGGLVVNGFDARFQARLGGGTATPADGYSFCWAADLPNGPFSEEGAGTGLIVTFDSFDNGDGEAPAIDVKWGGVTVGHVPVPVNLFISDPNFFPVQIHLDADGTLDVTYNGEAIYSDFAIPGFQAQAGARFGFGARTGGLHENLFLDNVTINASVVPRLLLSRPVLPDVAYDFNDGVLPPDTSSYGNAAVAASGGVSNSGVLKLTVNAGEQNGSFVVHDFRPGISVTGFQAAFKMRVGGGTVPPADGFSFCWAMDLPNGVWNEEGAGSGLTVAFDNYDNGGGESPAVDVKWGGLTRYRVRLPTLSTGSDFVDVFINLSPSRSGDSLSPVLDVVYGGLTIYNNFPLPEAAPLAGARFGLAARTGGLNDNHWVDDLCILAVGSATLPRLAIRLGGGNTVILSWLNPSTGYVLQQTANMDAPGGGWADVTQAPVINGANKEVMLQPVDQFRLFRLRHP